MIENPDHDIDHSFDEDRESHVQMNMLEYRPEFEVETRERTAWRRPITETTPSFEGAPLDIGDGLVTDIIEKFHNIGQAIQDKLTHIENRYRYQRIDFPDHLTQDLERAKTELGIENEGFTFQDYVLALDNMETPAGDYLVEITEQYFEGLDGNIQLELYQDYYELNKEHHLIEEYIYRNVSPILSPDSWDLDDEEWVESLLEKEKHWHKQKRAQDRRFANRQRIYKEAFLFNQGNLAYQRQLRRQEQANQQEMANQENQLTDTMIITNSKLLDLNLLLSQLDTIEKDQKTEDSKTLLKRQLGYVIEDNEQDMDLTHLELMLTLAVEKGNQEKHHLKHSLRDTYTESFLYKNMDELMVYQNLYNQDVLPLYKAINHFDDTVPREMEHFLNSVTKSMQVTSEEKEKRILDFQNTQKAMSLLRMDKLDEVKEKDTIRQDYQFIHQLKDDLNNT